MPDRRLPVGGVRAPRHERGEEAVSVRSYGETIDVRVGPGRSRTSARPEASVPGADADADTAGAPVQVLWRGRLYLVREVLAHWVELGTWWTRASRPAPSSSDRVPLGESQLGEDRVGVAAVPAEGPRSVAADVGAVEREVWRVEAASGRTAAVGVFDLVHDVRAADPRSAVPPAARWRLARALD